MRSSLVEVIPDDSPSSHSSTPVSDDSPGFHDITAVKESSHQEDTIQPAPKDTNIQSVAVDPESLEHLPRRPTLIEGLKRTATALSEKLPVHWRRNYLPEGRHSQRIDEHPDGYPRFTAYLNSDENFLVARRYGLLHTRMMLYRAAELAKLEDELLELDRVDAEESDNSLRDVKFLDRGERGEYRREVLNDIDEKLKQYDDIVLRHRAMSALPPASRRNYSSVANYLHHNAPLSGPDQELYKEDTDFAALVDPKEAVSLDSLVEDCLQLLPSKLTKFLFSTPEQRASTEDQLVHLYSKTRIDTFVRLIITLLAVALLMVPVVVLFSDQDNTAIKIVVILLFTLFFSIALSVFTGAKRHEVFAATAA